MKNIYFLFLPVFIFLLSCSGKKNAEPQNQSPQTANAEQNDVVPEVKTYPVEGGWGYDIYIGGKLYIHQPTIPAVSGNHAFQTETDAKKTGDLATEKIRQNILPPSITTAELDSLGILVK